MAFFHLFSEAIGSLSKGDHKIAEIRNAIASLKSAQRFYLPPNIDVVSGRPLAEIGSEMPFNDVCILTKEINADYPVISCFSRISEDIIGLVSIVKQTKKWAVFPHARIRIASPVWYIETMKTPLHALYVEAIGKEIDAREYVSDLNRLMNLIAMLSLHNVKTKLLSPPVATNQRRKSRGKLPLYSYHVLDVGGEVWDTPGADDGDGQGYRSHLRRGHIRRLSDDRCVWVRATFVHGAIKGFVDKDYNVLAA